MPGHRCYAGVGSRRAPREVLGALEDAAAGLARRGWTLRTGLSPGADQAFFRGALTGGGRVELYLPRPGFQAGARVAARGHPVRVLPAPTGAALALAACVHPAWEELSTATRALRARDVHEVLGSELSSPVGLLVCWTPDGSLDGEGPGAGGTGQALRVAAAHGVPVLNVRRRKHMRRLRGLARGGRPGAVS